MFCGTVRILSLADWAGMLCGTAYHYRQTELRCTAAQHTVTGTLEWDVLQQPAQYATAGDSKLG